MGDTGVFFNGREIHTDELAELLQMFDEVPPGRYWLGADLVGGIEGQPASFDLNGARRDCVGRVRRAGLGLFRGPGDRLLRPERLPFRLARRDRRHEQLRARLRQRLSRCSRAGLLWTAPDLIRRSSVGRRMVTRRPAGAVLAAAVLERDVAAMAAHDRAADRHAQADAAGLRVAQFLQPHERREHPLEVRLRRCPARRRRSRSAIRGRRLSSATRARRP